MAYFHRGRTEQHSGEYAQTIGDYEAWGKEEKAEEWRAKLPDEEKTEE